MRVALGFRGMTMKLKLAVIALFTVFVCGLYIVTAKKKVCIIAQKAGEIHCLFHKRVVVAVKIQNKHRKMDFA